MRALLLAVLLLPMLPVHLMAQGAPPVAPVPGAMVVPGPAGLPVVLEWEPGVGDRGGMVLTTQADNERLARHIYVKRVIDDGQPVVIRWEVRPSGEYPAKPNLFRTEGYPWGIVRMEKGQRTADVVVKTYETEPDWHREFEVVLKDPTTGMAILDAYMMPIEVVFGVAGDLRCAPGRTDLCDPDPNGAMEGNPFGVGKDPGQQD